MGRHADGIGFTGQRLDGFGLMDYNARYYSNTLGRFVQPDTIIPQPGNPMAWDRYSYANNSPINYSDPSGHCAILATALTGAIIRFSIDILVQAVPDILNGESITINWAEAGGEAVAGAISGLTFGVGMALVAPTTVAATVVSGAVVGGTSIVIGNQAGYLVESSLSTGAELFSNNNYENASDFGFFDVEVIEEDFIFGAVAGALSARARPSSKVPRGIDQYGRPYVITN